MRLTLLLAALFALYSGIPETNIDPSLVSPSGRIAINRDGTPVGSAFARRDAGRR